MTRKAFRKILAIIIWLTPIWLATCVVFLGDFIVEGGLLWPPLTGFAVLFALGSSLIFSRCQACDHSLAWISTHKNINDQPDPRTLDLCPKCGEPFFKEPNPES